MATFTANYNLRKPAGGDLVTVSTDINANMDIIDAELDDHEDRLDVLEANLGVKGQEVFVLKTADESVGGTTNQNDNELFIALQNGTYLIEVFLFVTGADAGDISTAYEWTGTMTVTGRTWGLASDATTLGPTGVRSVTGIEDSTSPAVGGVFGTVTGQNVTLESKLLVVVTAPGTFRLVWSKNDSAGINTVVEAGSFMTVKQVQ